MNRVFRFFLSGGFRRWMPFQLLPLACAAAMLLSGGCMTREMKGTPFFTGEYSKRNGPAEKRVNLWPVYYYRDPALSILWPIIEFTDDHTAIRPVFSIYGLDETNREYNVAWPLSQFDRKNRENFVFPVYWGTNYGVVFPVYWHYGAPFGTNGGSLTVFPLAYFDRVGTNKFCWLAPVPVAGAWRDRKSGESGSLFFPLYWHEKDAGESLWLSPLWMHGCHTNGSRWNLVSLLCYESKTATNACFVTPLWSEGKSASREWHAATPFVYWDAQQRSLFSPLWAQWERPDHRTWFSPALLSWMKSYPNHTDLWMAGGLAKAAWGTNAGPYYLFPIYWRNPARTNLLTPLFGWNSGREGFWYPLTPLAGVRTGGQSGGWLFPVFSHKATTNGVEDRFALISGRDATTNAAHQWVFPLYSYHNNGPINTNLPTRDHPTWGRKFWCLPFCWYEHQRGFWPDFLFPGPGHSGTNALSLPKTVEECEYRYKHGVFPLYSYSTNANPRMFHYVTKRTAGLIFYDYKHEFGPLPAKNSTALNDYTRARVLWRLWHYERLNGDVGVDVFPGVTYDRKKDGYKKVSVWWRLYRHERTAKNKVSLDLFFIPVKRP